MKQIYTGKQQGNYTIENFRKALGKVAGSTVIEEFHVDNFLRLKVFMCDEVVTVEYSYNNVSKKVVVNLYGNEKNFRKVAKYLQ
ncbi:hypothetical protein H8D91_00710 [archaeon]|nr:hypothetical protein [archaeon]